MLVSLVLSILVIEPPASQPKGESLEAFIKRVAPAIIEAHEKEAGSSRIIKGSASSLTNSLKMRADIEKVSLVVIECEAAKAVATRKKARGKLSVKESAFIEFVDLMTESLDLPKRFTVQIQAAKQKDERINRERREKYWEQLRAHQHPPEPKPADNAAKVISTFTNRIKVIENKYDKYIAGLRGELPEEPAEKRPTRRRTRPAPPVEPEDPGTSASRPAWGHAGSDRSQ